MFCSNNGFFTASIARFTVSSPKFRSAARYRHLNGFVMDDPEVVRAMERVKAAMEGVYGRYDPEFKNMAAVEEGYADGFFVKNISNNPGSEFYDAYHENRERIRLETERLQKANKEREVFEWQKKQYEAWIKRREAHKSRSLMPFMERPPRVMPSVIKYFEDKEREKEREKLRKKLEATLMTNDTSSSSSSSLFAPTAENGKYTPPCYTHLNPLLANYGASTTIMSKDKKGVLSSVRPPVPFRAFKSKLAPSKTTPIAQVNPLMPKPAPLQPIVPKDKEETKPSARLPVLPSLSKPKPAPLPPTDAASKLAPSKVVPDTPLKSLFSSTAPLPTIMLKDKKETMPSARPPVLLSPKPAPLPPTVAVPELVPSKVVPETPLKSVFPTDAPLPAIQLKKKTNRRPPVTPSLLKPKPNRRPPPTVDVPELPKIPPFFFNHLPGNMAAMFEPTGGCTSGTSQNSACSISSLRVNLPPKSPLFVGSYSTDLALKVVDAKKDEHQHEPEKKDEQQHEPEKKDEQHHEPEKKDEKQQKPEDDDLEEGEIVDDDDEEQVHRDKDDREAVERRRTANRHREEDERSDRHRHRHREDEKISERDRKTYRAREEDEPRDRHRQKRHHREEDEANERHRQKSRHHEDVPKEGSISERRRDKHRQHDDHATEHRRHERRDRDEKDSKEGDTSERSRNEHRRREEADLGEGSSSGRHRKDRRHREEDSRDAKK